jgi:hypothetical protein
MPATWPPPPDLESIRELVRAADVEGHLADGAPADEYEPEEDAIFEAIKGWPTEALITGQLFDIIAQVWRRSFVLDDVAMAQREPALLGLAQQIELYFGPDARPQVR